MCIVLKAWVVIRSRVRTTRDTGVWNRRGGEWRWMVKKKGGEWGNLKDTAYSVSGICNFIIPPRVSEFGRRKER